MNATEPVAHPKGRPMAKIITRYFDRVQSAKNTRYELVQMRNAPSQIVTIAETTDQLDRLLASAPVETATAKEYKKRLAKGGAVLLVRAGYKPLGIARMAREAAASEGAVDLGKLVEEVSVPDEVREPMSSIFADHPRFLTKPRDPDSKTFHMANWPIPLLSRGKPSEVSIFSKHARMASWPIGLVAPEKPRYGAFPFGLLVPGNGFMAKFPIAHLVPGHRFMAKFPFAHLVPGKGYMAKFPFAHLVPGHKFMAKFPFGHLVPGHARMANWPFPLLIDGEQGTNAIVPGHKFMAKFPFAHLVPGKGYMAKFPFAHLVPGHKFMAKFPFGHLVPGHRFMAKFPFAHIVPGHKYMANFVFPHTQKAA